MKAASASSPSPSPDSCNLLGKIFFFFFSPHTQEKILVVPITRKTKSSAGHQGLPEAGNNVQGELRGEGLSWKGPPSRNPKDTGPGPIRPAGEGR